MKRNIFFKTVLVIAVISSLSGCKKFLDQVPDDRQTIDDVFKKRPESEKYLAGVYDYIRSNSEWNGDSSPWEGLSDEIDVTYNDYPTFAMNTGNWDKNRDNFNFWVHYYQGIRRASYFMQRLPENPEIEAGLMSQYIAEARVLRAYFYSGILAQYGPFIILPETVISPDADISTFSLPRSSYDECVNYIVAELDKAMADLPPGRGSVTDFGRMKRGMALAIKSRTLLYAASPMFNGNTVYADFKNPDGKVLISQSFDVNKWKRAAEAAKELIDNPDYSLYREVDAVTGALKVYESLKGIFIKAWNSEVILSRYTTDKLGSYDQNGTPYILGGWSSWGPTQTAVDAYFMANGLPKDDPNSQYTEIGFTNTATAQYAAGTSNMYVGREPRFYNAITFNLSKWINNSSNNIGGTGSAPITIQMYNGGNSGQYNGRNWSRTGYCVRKHVNPNSRMGSNSIVADRAEVLFRLGEIYLNYAEALNEYSPGHPDIKKYINMIRERAGIPQYGAGAGFVPEPADQGTWRIAIHRERRVELAFECHRYFDVRRWKIAEQTDGGPFYGMDINATTTAAFTKRTVFETRVFLPRNYLWNILPGELNKNKNLVPNPGW
ncbi:Starch-binding associating with outer membrane [Pedobacter steynii]|uniref:Starch-binding associating with outer membrane n=1 Tax=Pedobacter steynii TaxID=430522 RepID=A0A1G9PEK9_9SPHI|nr:RagB/SusD family nutrient uptake outer membrane protein [Pedobacter steynii]NQX39020.1 RagB/SusD family nutrient uptake outer membrane protein [Pedobacter steynii]SDL96647.1 Starch-binding associating with outer membrane [Pedobacter steynii]